MDKGRGDQEPCVCARAGRGTSSCKHSELLEHTPLEGVCIHNQRGETGGPVTEVSFPRRHSGFQEVGT